MSPDSQPTMTPPGPDVDEPSIFDVNLPAAPYPGLRPFEREEWPIFFGRELIVDEVITRVIKQQFVVVHGDSGCGKSSLIRAGVLPRLEQEHVRSGARWRTGTMLPRNEPLRNFAEMLAELDGRAGDEARIVEFARLLNQGRSAAALIATELRHGGEDQFCLLIDQFEELFAFAERHGGDEAQAFVDVLVGLQQDQPPGLSMILTMRSEFLGVCARYRGLAEAVNGTQYLLPRMEHAALLRAICEPAILYGGAIDRDLAERLIADASGNQDELPLIQHGLTRLWRRHARKAGAAADATPWVLSLHHYGGEVSLKALLSDHADSVLREAVATPGTGVPDPRREAIAEHLFRALTDINAEGQAIRRPQIFSSLLAVTGADRATLVSILDVLRADGVSFIKPYEGTPIDDNSLIDISHEALIRCWGRIADRRTGWLQTEFHDGLIWRSLAVQAQSFAENTDNVLSIATTGERASWLKARTEAWSRRYGNTWKAVGDLIKASVAASDREHRNRRRVTIGLYSGVAIVCILLVGSVLLAIYAFDKAQETEKMLVARKADAARRIAQTATDELREGSAVAAALLALSVLPRTEDAGAAARLEGVLAAALARQREVVVLGTPTGPVRGGGGWGRTPGLMWAAFSPDDTRVATASEDGTVRVWSAGPGQALAVLSGHSKTVWMANFSPDGKFLVSASDDGTARVWSVDEKKQIASFSVGPGRVRMARFSSDGKQVLIASDDRSAAVWAADGSGSPQLFKHDDKVRSAVFSKDDKLVLTASDDRTARIWSVQSGREVARLKHEGRVNSAVFSPDEQRVLTASDDGTVKVWNADGSGEPLSFGTQGGRYRSASFSPNGDYILAVSSDDSNAWVWRIKSRIEPQPLVGHDGRIRSASFTPDGSRIVTVSDDRTIRIWRPGTLNSASVLRGHDDSIRSVDFNGDGTLILTASDDGTARIWRLQPKDQHVLLGQRRVPVSASFSADLLRLASAGDRTAHLWQVAGSQQPTINIDGHTAAVQAVEISPDDRYVVTGSEDASVRLWHLADSRSTLLMTHKDVVRWVSFSADGRHVVSASNDRTAQIASVDGKEPVGILTGHTEGLNFAAFSPDGNMVVTAADDRTARVWRLGDNPTSVELKPHDGSVVFAAFSPDGKKVATASEDHVVRIWRTEGGEPLHTLKGHTLGVRSVRFSRDGSFVVTVGEDGTVRIWSAESGRIERIIPVDQDVILDARLSADNGTLVLASSRLGSRSILVHKVSWGKGRDDLMREACKLMPRQLGGEERARFGLEATDVSACAIPPR